MSAIAESGFVHGRRSGLRGVGAFRNHRAFTGRASLVLLATLAACFAEAEELEGTSTDDAQDSSTGPGTATPAGGTTSGGQPGSETSESSASSGDDTGGSGSSTGADLPDGMVLILGSTFDMGCDQSVEETSCDLDEFPVHAVELSSYAIDITEVTVGAYEDCVVEGGCSPRDTAADSDCNIAVDDAQHPANCVTWSQAAAYCEWAGKRLPSEAQWEFAAEGQGNSRWPWGDAPNPNCDLAVIVTDGPGCGTNKTAPVGSRPEGSTAAGVADMTGNVSEWVADWYSETAYGEWHDTVDPTGPPSGASRVRRGADFESGAVASLRVRNRVASDPEVVASTAGFRCVLDVGEAGG